MDPLPIEALRRQHPRLIYEAYDYSISNQKLFIRISLCLEPEIRFAPEITIPLPADGVRLAPQELDLLVFHLGLIELISYWKAACPPEVVIAAGHLDAAQIAWWEDLFLHGLGEFFYRNNIDFTSPNFLHLTSTGKPHQRLLSAQPSGGQLILLGGGKDSAVTLELLKSFDATSNLLILYPISSAIATATAAGFDHPLVTTRTIDPRLLELNAAGYLNGHTPFSAYLAFFSLLVASLYGHQHIVLSNERSAGEESLTYRGLPINHQYSKSLRFEQMFRNYCTTYLSTETQYFSFLRPLHDLQISAIFAQHPTYYQVFRSCNVGQKLNSWCGACPKCAFVYISLFPFLPIQQLLSIFGRELYSASEIEPHIRALVGLADHKPFECVGTQEESVAAISLGIRKCTIHSEPVPPLLQQLAEELQVVSPQAQEKAWQWLTTTWSDQHYLPVQYRTVLETAFHLIAQA